MARLSDKRRAALDELMQKNICAAAEKVIVEHGIQKMTMAKVAEAADIAKGTIYNYFKDRKELLKTIAASIFEPLDKQITEIFQSSIEPLLKLRKIAEAMLETFSRHKKVFILIHEANISGMLGKKSNPFGKREKILGLIKNICKQAITEKAIRAENTDVLAEIFLGMVMSINISKITSDSQRPVEADLEIIMSIFTKGLQAEPLPKEK